jgi:hypothetical protein
MPPYGGDTVRLMAPGRLAVVASFLAAAIRTSCRRDLMIANEAEHEDGWRAEVPAGEIDSLHSRIMQVRPRKCNANVARIRLHSIQ